MNSEKVKEIKENLEEEIGFSIEYDLEFRRMPSDTLQDILTLINELESENERLMKLQARGGCRVAELGIENQQLKDRIAELEKEIKENPSYAKGYADGIKNTYEVVIPEKLKQFVERLKEKMGVREYMGVKYKQGVFSENDIDETLKEFIK